jgi:hypothetical protein
VGSSYVASLLVGGSNAVMLPQIVPPHQRTFEKKSRTHTWLASKLTRLLSITFYRNWPTSWINIMPFLSLFPWLLPLPAPSVSSAFRFRAVITYILTWTKYTQPTWFSRNTSPTICMGLISSSTNNPWSRLEYIIFCLQLYTPPWKGAGNVAKRGAIIRSFRNTTR